MIKKALLSRTKIIVLILVLALSVSRVSKEKEAFPVGDALEYVLITEAIYNHGSPDIRYSDYESFIKLYSKTKKWETSPAAMFYDQAGAYLANEKLSKFESFRGFFVDENNEKHSCHFFVYSLVNIPLRFICEFIPFNPFLINSFTNVLLLLITCFLFFKYSPIGEIETSIFVLLFFYSTNYWYLLWQHPEVFTTCFVSLGFWLFVSKKYYSGILLVSIASLQNQPIAILVATLCIITLFINRITIKNIFLIGLSSIWVLLPSAFYYYHFGVPSLITHVGSMQTRLITFTRVFGFFFDLNQGVILAFPFILILYLGFIIRKIILFKTQDNKWELLIPLALVGAVCSAASIDNWNSGQAVVSRYATYIGGIILVHCFLLIVRMKSKKAKWTFIGLSLVTQIATVYYHESITKHDWSTSAPKPISDWVLTKEPQLYNPDPTIFLTRYGTLVIQDTSKSPAYFMKTTGQITKFLVHKNYMYNLVNFGIPKEQIYKALEGLCFENDWAYINVDKEFKSYFSPTKLKAIDNERRVLSQMKLIKTIPDWFQKIKLKAKQKGIEESEMLRRDAAFVLSIPIVIYGTREEIIKKTIIEMKSTPEWNKLMVWKANKLNITLDSAMTYEATMIANEEIKKQKELNDE